MKSATKIMDSKIPLGKLVDNVIVGLPPLWPLRHFVAVNPYLEYSDMKYSDYCRLHHAMFGELPLLTAEDYLELYRSGAIQDRDISTGEDPVEVNKTLSELMKLRDTISDVPVLTVADLLDQERPHAHWSVFVVEEVSKWCAALLDQGQATWSGHHTSGLFQDWKKGASVDLSPEAFGLVGFRKFVATLPDDANSCIAHCVDVLQPSDEWLELLLRRELSTVLGWAGHLQYLSREKGLQYSQRNGVRDLLAIRLSYDAALYRAFSSDSLFRVDWKNPCNNIPDTWQIGILERFQKAYETNYQRQLCRSLMSSKADDSSERPWVQAVFCIDVRSEPVRRHMESLSSRIQTLGFAGFFGFPLELAEVPSWKSARCPALLKPTLSVESDLHDENRLQFEGQGAWKAFQNAAVSMFTFVEALGITYSLPLARMKAKPIRHCSRVDTLSSTATLDSLADYAYGALQGMGLVGNYARVVFLCGHGSECVNNPHASGLDCGACGGHAGDANARFAASVFNNPKIRDLLKERGLDIPEDTMFIPGLHNTVTDEICLLDERLIPSSHKDDVSRLKAWLDLTGEQCRNEKHGAVARPSASILAEVRNRTTDISQIRPEWGLANNAAIILAPRSRTRGVNLSGRVFLHEFDHSSPSAAQVLKAVLSGPVVVSSWINLQYYASRVNPEIFGSGDKLLHNVVAGLGVLEGNGGDLRPGLPLQSLHDGTRFIHEARRLSVLIDAPRIMVDEVLSDLPQVRSLFINGWIHLLVAEGDTIHRLDDTLWTEIS